MRFALIMAWRDSRASRRRLALYSVSVVLGIAALVSIGSFGANVRRAIEGEAKALLGADLFVTSPSPLEKPVVDALVALGGERAEEETFSSMMTFPKSGALRLVQVHALEGPFPFYGSLETDPADAAAALKSGRPVVLLEPTLMAQFGVHVGDSVKLGRTLFTLVGSLKKVPGESPAAALMAPRAYIPRSTLDAAGLTGTGALARHRMMLKLPPGADPAEIVRRLREAFPAVRLSFDTVEQRKENLGRALTNLDGFLSLVGFVALVLGGIGVASALHGYIRGKVGTVAILRCLGARSRQGVLVYLAQGLAVGLMGAFAGGALGVAIQRGLPALARGVLPVDVAFFVSWTSVLRGMGAGLVICLLFSLIPLLSVRRVPPLAALRASAAEAVGPDPWVAVIASVLALFVAGFAVWQTGNVAVGLGFAAMLGLGFGVLAGVALLVSWAARRCVPESLPYVVRQGIANLHRPNNRTLLLLLSLGLGTFLILTLFLVRASLLKEIRGADTSGRPNLVFFDIQSDQMDPLAGIAAAAGAPVLERAPVVTMKIRTVRGLTVEQMLSSRDHRLAAWALRREYRSTYRGTLTDSEKVVAGTLAPRAPPGPGPIPVSVEEGLAKDMQLKLGDEVTWDVQGLDVRTRVGSIRSVEWRRLEPNFFIVFPEGALEEAPQTFIAAMRTRSPAQSAEVQRAVVNAFPNVTAIDLTLVAETLDGIFSKVAFGIQFMALFTVATGLVVLAGTIVAGRHQRIRESVLLRTLGATGSQVTGIQLVEYAVLGVQGAIVGAALALLGSGLLARFVFHIPWAPSALDVTAGIAVVASLTVVTGFAAGRGIAREPPLQTLRQEE